MAPSTMQQYTLEGHNGVDSLTFNDSAPVPTVGDRDVLVKIEGVALNFRDIMILNGRYPKESKPSVVPCSDGAGTVVQTGLQVTRFKPGDKVITLFNQGHLAGTLDAQTINTGLGAAMDGTLRQYGIFSEEGLVHAPAGLSAIEASTLTCAGLTAWNALFGSRDKPLKIGDTVLVQGSGGVSLFALQFAKAAGAIVIATTSSEAKVAILKSLGADYVINYASNPDWGTEAKEITHGRGVDIVVEVAGPASMQQSLEALAIGGMMSIIGTRAGGRSEKEPSFLLCAAKVCTARGILVGSRQQMEDMCKAVQGNLNKLRPILDKKVFKFEEARAAYQYMDGGKHFGKICIEIN